MSERKTGFARKIFGIVISPRRTIGDISEKDVWRGTIIVLVTALLAAWAGFNYGQKTPFKLPEALMTQGQPINPDAFKANVLTFMAMFSAVRVVASWTALTLLLRASGALFGGKGGVRRMFALSAFAHVPVLIQQSMRFIDSTTITKETILGITAAKSTNVNPILSLLNDAYSVFTIFGLWTFALIVMAVSANNVASLRRGLLMTLVAYSLSALIRMFVPLI